MPLNRRTLAPIALSLALLGATAAQAEPVAYTLDPTHTQVDFRWQHLGLSTPAASMDQVQGTLNWDAANPTRSSVRVTMPVAGVRTRVAALDEHFRSAPYFDAAAHPNVTFESTRVERARGANRYRVHGNLTIKGITRPVVLDARLNAAKPHPMFKAPAVGFNATGSVKRSDFDMKESLPMVSDRIELNITAEAVEAQGYAAALKAMGQ